MAKTIDINALKEFKKKCDETYSKDREIIDITPYFTRLEGGTIPQDIYNKLINEDVGIQATLESTTYYAIKIASESGTIMYAVMLGGVAIADVSFYEDLSFRYKLLSFGGDYELLYTDSDGHLSQIGANSIIYANKINGKYTLGANGAKDIVLANPSENATSNLTKIKLGDTTYNISSSAFSTIILNFYKENDGRETSIRMYSLENKEATTQRVLMILNNMISIQTFNSLQEFVSYYNQNDHWFDSLIRNILSLNLLGITINPTLILEGLGIDIINGGFVVLPSENNTAILQEVASTMLQQMGQPPSLKLRNITIE